MKSNGGLPEREVRSGEVIEFFGMRYVVPLVTDLPRTVIAINIAAQPFYVRVVP
jgi:hypothetical protein